MDECGNYFLQDLERLGRGGFGEVFKVNIYNRRKDNVTVYARKYFSPLAENDSTPVRQVADLRERFLVEIKTQCKLNTINYDVIAPIVLFNTDGDKPYFVMELAECNLHNLIQQGMSTEDKADAILQILDGVELIHQNQYIHRDLKPENVLKYGNGRYKISDFGLVKDLDAVRAEIRTRFRPNGIGSDGYRAPEITDSGLFSERSDIYAVGKIISDVYGATANAGVRDIINKCTAFIPDYRYVSIDDLRKDFVKAVIKVEEVA